MKHRPAFLDFALLLFISFVWGSSFTAIKIGLKSFDPFSLAASRVIVGGLFLYLVGRLRGEVFPTSPAVLKRLVVMGLFGSSAFILISWGQQYVASSTAGIMLAFGPLVLLVLAHFMTEDEKLTAPKLMGFVLGFIGVLMLFKGVEVKGGVMDLLGMGALFTAAFCYALAMIYIRRLGEVSSINVATGFLLMAAVIAFPLSIAFDPIWAHEVTTEGALAILFLGLFSTGLSSIFLIVLVKRAGATFSSYSNYLTPLVAIIWGVLLFRETITLVTWLALALILGGIALGSLYQPKKPLQSGK